MMLKESINNFVLKKKFYKFFPKKVETSRMMHNV